MSESNQTLPLDLREAVRSCFVETLKRDDFDDQSDFFALGGDSLGATNLLTRLAETTGRQLSGDVFFQHPTVESLATVVQKTEASGDGDSLDALIDDLSDLDEETLARLLQQ